MKKDIFARFVDHYNKDGQYTFHKHVETGSFQCYLFKVMHHTIDNQIEKLKADMLYLKENGIKTHIDIAGKYSKYKLMIRTISVGYDSVTDKFSITELESGYNFSHKTKRFFPYSKKIPCLIFTNKVYFFNYIRGVSKIRLFTGRMNQYDYKTWGTLILGSNVNTSLPICITNYFNETDEYKLLEKKLKVKIPKSLRIFKCNELYQYLKPLRNKQEINTLCQYIAKNGPSKGANRIDTIDEINRIGPVVYKLIDTITDMMLGESGHTWLVRDFVDDLHALNLKYSFKLRSYNRMMDEHNKMSRLRQLKHVSSIKTDDKYRILVDGFPYDAKLIDNKASLLEEGITQHHCVVGYASRINNGSCAIFTMNYEGKRWTAEIQFVTVTKHSQFVTVTKHSQFVLNQLRGFENEDSPEYMKIMIRHYLSQFNPKDQLVESTKKLELVIL